jgi:fatty-acyl-CoA synthase
MSHNAMYETGLDKTPANFGALTPLNFIDRAAHVYPDAPAIAHGAIRRTWRETYDRVRRLASALASRGIGRGATVAALLPNTPAMVEAHFGVPMAGAVLNALNTRLDEATIAFMLNHGEAVAILVDSEFAGLLRRALSKIERPLLVIDVDDPEYTGARETPFGAIGYEALLAQGDPDYAWQPPADEWDAICLNYTSGTTGDPKGVVYHHRGAYTNAISNILEWDLPKHPVYLWTLPMFHCNGWCFPWTVAARAGVNVCLRKVEAQAIFDLIREEGVTHMCGAPIVYNMLVHASDTLEHGIGRRVNAMVAGAAPPAAMIEGLERLGFELIHVYGLTETYGPASVCAKHAAWGLLDSGERARLNSRQGVRYHLQDEIAVCDPDTLVPVPSDGETIGEVMFRGNIAMKGYLKNPAATAAAFAGGWFHTGDLAVIFPDGYIKIKDRSKDIIISGGENVSSIEIEDTLYRHPAVMAAAVVAKPDAKWGETPCAFIELKPGASVTGEELIAYCKQHLAGFKVPRAIVFGELPKTSTGKIQKFVLRKLAGSASAVAG